MASNDAFPHFANGDVEIVLTPVRRLKLHSDVLRGVSARLAEFLTTDQAAILSKRALADGSKIRYRLELVGVPATPNTSNPGRLILIVSNPPHPIVPSAHRKR